MSAGARGLLDRALRRRAPLAQDGGTTAFRWLNGEGDGAPGLTLDVLGDVAVLSTYDGVDPGAVADAAMGLLPLRAVYLKARPREAGRLRGEERAARAPALPLRGEPVESVDVQEQGLRFRIRPGEGLAVGLYLDTRRGPGVGPGARRRAHAAQLLLLHRRLRGGGAGRWRDPRGRRRPQPALARLGGGERAAQRTDAPGDGPAGRRRVRVAEALRQAGGALRRGGAGSPGFARGRSGTFSAARDWPGLAAQAAALVAPGGWLLAACNVVSLSGRRFDAALAEGVRQAGRTAEEVARPGASEIDFPSPAGEEPPLKVRVLRLRGANLRGR